MMKMDNMACKMVGVSFASTIFDLEIQFFPVSPTLYQTRLPRVISAFVNTLFPTTFQPIMYRHARASGAVKFNHLNVVKRKSNNSWPNAGTHLTTFFGPS